MVERQVVAYEPSFDRLAYRSKDIDREKLNSYTKRQIETHLGERFNVLLSTTRYEVKNGQIYPEKSDEPFINSLIRGRNYRRLNGNPVDFAREDAEVIGFSKTEAIVSSGNIAISISQRGGEGSIYKHNFYDIFTPKEDEKGKYIEARRYSSGLSLQETTGKLKNLGFIPQDSNPTVEDYLSSPIDINSDSISAEELHKLLHKEHEYTSNEEFEKTMGIVAPLIVARINWLADHPFDEESDNANMNAILNGMDYAMGFRNDRALTEVDLSKVFQNKEFISALSQKPVRQVMTGCGLSGGFGVSLAKDLINSPFSVADKDQKKSSEKQILCCTCPFCNREVEAEIGGGKITCPNCKKSASWN